MLLSCTTVPPVVPVPLAYRAFTTFVKLTVVVLSFKPGRVMDRIIWPNLLSKYLQAKASLDCFLRIGSFPRLKDTFLSHYPPMRLHIFYLGACLIPSRLLTLPFFSALTDIETLSLWPNNDKMPHHVMHSSFFAGFVSRHNKDIDPPDPILIQ